MQPVKSACSNSWDRIAIMPGWSLTSRRGEEGGVGGCVEGVKEMLHFSYKHAARSAPYFPNVSIQKTNDPVLPPIT